MKNRQWLLARRPHGAIQDSDFSFVEADAPTPGEGEVLVRNLMLSCDPTQRGWIAFDTYLPAVKIGEVIRSIGAGRIVASNNPDFAEAVHAYLGHLSDAAIEEMLNELATELGAALGQERIYVAFADRTWIFDAGEHGT
jgi:NADPH-dependent curcumin reductase CurA